MSSNVDHDVNVAAKQGWAIGIAIVAAALLFVAGLVGVFQGISGIANDDILVVGQEYIYQFDLTTWGWIHLIVGVLAIIIAGGLAVAATWARAAAIVIASFSIITQFLWLPHYPVWAILIIALDVLVIWAAATVQPLRR